MEEISKLEANHKVAQQKAKKHIKKLQEDLKEASSLFQQTLKVKQSYEKIIVKLVNDPVAKSATQREINQYHSDQLFSQDDIDEELG